MGVKMKLKEVIGVPDQDNDYKVRMNKSFEIIKNGVKKQKLSSWRNLSLFKSSNDYIVIDSDDKLVYGFLAKPFMQGISIIWAENFSNGSYKNLTKEIIFELLKSGISEIYTDNKQTKEMMSAHKKIITEINKKPYRQVEVLAFNTTSNKTSKITTDIFDDRNLMFQFTWSQNEKKHSFQEDIDSSSWGVHQAYLLAELLGKEINEDFIPNLSDLEPLREEAQSKFSQQIIDKKMSNIYDSGSEWIYEYYEREI